MVGTEQEPCDELVCISGSNFYLFSSPYLHVYFTASLELNTGGPLNCRTCGTLFS